ncbi:MAG: DMT family transporter [Flavobacteriales bacterium]|jgi:drug/metabolite transporter (DMT)-like permease|nr:DMT family transporter [Flavobacteriales bacterium]
MNKKILFSHIALFVANLIYAINFTVAKEVMPTYLQPLGFILLRVSGAVILFWLLHQLMKHKLKIDRKDWPRLILCGLSGVALNQMLFFKGLNLTTPINAAVIMTSTPILVFTGALLLKQEKLNWVRMIGLILGGIGAVGIILYGKTNMLSHAPNPGKGNLYVFINAACYASYLLLAKPLMQKYHPITIITLCFSIGWLVVLPFGWEEAFSAEYHLMPDYILFAIGFVILFTTFFTYLLNIIALKNVRASTVSFYIYSQPLLATFIAIIFSSDKLDFVKIVSGLAIFIGVYLVSAPKKSLKRKIVKD